MIRAMVQPLRAAVNNLTAGWLQCGTPLCRRHLKVLSAVVNVEDGPSMENYLRDNVVKYTVGPTSFAFKCQSSSCHGTGQDNDSQLNVYVNKITGTFHCQHCQMKGSWEDLKALVAGKAVVSDPPPAFEWPENSRDTKGAQDTRAVYERSPAEVLAASTPVTECRLEFRYVLDDLFKMEKLHERYLNVFDVCVIDWPLKGTKDLAKHLVFPWYGPDGKTVVRLKLVPATSGGWDASVLYPEEGNAGLFGINLVPMEAKQVILTATELDAIAVWQETGMPAVSLPYGLSSLPLEVLPYLERFRQIAFWFGNNVHERQASSSFGLKLNMRRCFVVGLSDENAEVTSPLVLLNENCDLGEVARRIQPMGHSRIISFKDLRKIILHDLTHHQELCGVPWKRFPQLTRLLKGHRLGELTVLTGPTGSGKTTLLSELSLDLCESGVRTLWGSFELKNNRLGMTMLRQLSGCDLKSNDLEVFHKYADILESMPMYFMGFHGSQHLPQVLDAMRHAAFIYDIQHVLIDNMQFMLGIGSQADNRFAIMDQTYAAFRQFATEMQVHVTLVIHPRKEDDDADLQTASVFGSAKATQEADNVLIIQQNRNQKYIQVAKNRFDGDVGFVDLFFDKQSLAFSKEDKKMQRMTKKSTVNEAVEESSQNSEGLSEETAGKEHAVEDIVEMAGSANISERKLKRSSPKCVEVLQKSIAKEKSNEKVRSVNPLKAIVIEMSQTAALGKLTTDVHGVNPQKTVVTQQKAAKEKVAEEVHGVNPQRYTSAYSFRTISAT